jgi:regulator of sigma E protease
MDALLTTLSSIFWVAIVLGILITIHELGHFLSARLFGMRVDAFSIGFGKSLYKKTVGDTEYRLGVLPLGGYVKIAGMVDESMDVDGLASEPQPDEYRSKPVWQRMVVITAGVIFNLILAFVVYAGLAFAYPRVFTPAENVALEVATGSTAYAMGLRSGDRIVAAGGEELEGFEDAFDPNVFTASPLRLDVLRDGPAGQPAERVALTGPDDLVTQLSRAQRAAEDAGQEVTLGTVFGVEPRFSAVLADVIPDTPAAEAGLRPGDRIVSVGGRPIRYWSDLTAAIGETRGQPVPVQWRRGEETLSATVTPQAQGERYVMGIALDATTLGVETERLGAGAAIASGFDRTVATTATYFGFIGKLFAGRENVRESLGGPLVIARESKRAADAGGQSFWSFLAFLSIALAVFNILPIPALDGGHLVFLIYEGIVRREPSLKVRMVVQQVGLVLILALMAFVILNDAVRLFG